GDERNSPATMGSRPIPATIGPRCGVISLAAAAALLTLLASSAILPASSLARTAGRKYYTGRKIMAGTIFTSDPEQRERKRLARYRAQFVQETPSWYRGEYHLAFTLLVTGGTFYYCWTHIHNSTLAEWLLIIPIALFGNWAEWAGHRYILHRPVPY